jgi:RimJ/RimL family protein N-acetyltransferase
MSDNEVRLLGDRVLLREFVDTDEKVVHSYASDPEVTRFMDWGPNSIEDTRNFLREAARPSRKIFPRRLRSRDSRHQIPSRHRQCSLVGNQRRAPPR